MMKKRSSHGYFLESTRMLIQNAKADEEIRTLLVPYRVDEQKLEDGLALCNRAYDAENKQIKLHGQQYRSYKKFEKEFDAANEVYQIHLKFLKISYEKDTEKLKEISAYGDRSKNIPTWFKQAFAFYQTTILDEEAMTELDSFGITAELFQQNEANVKNVESAYLEHQLKLGAAQNAVVLRDEVFKELATYAKRLRAICRTALRDYPQLLEKLGIRVYSEGYVSAKSKANGEQPPADGSTQTTANAGAAANEETPVKPVVVQAAAEHNKKKKGK